MTKSNYYINMEEIICNITAEEVLVLECLKDTDRFSGQTIKDMLETESISALGCKHSKVYFMLERLKLISAVGAVVSSRSHSYYIKEVGQSILDYLDNIVI